MQQLFEFVGNHETLSIIWVGLVLALIVSWIASLFSKIKQLSPHQLTMKVNREDAVVVDIRPGKEFKAGHIVGAKSLSQEDVNKNNFASLENAKDKPIIVVCTAGLTANRTAKQLLKAGFENVSLLKGGMTAWQNASLPVKK